MIGETFNDYGEARIALDAIKKYGKGDIRNTTVYLTHIIIYDFSSVFLELNSSF